MAKNTPKASVLCTAHNINIDIDLGTAKQLTSQNKVCRLPIAGFVAAICILLAPATSVARSSKRPIMPVNSTIVSPSSDLSITVGDTVAFSGSCSGGAAPYTVRWSFGDGSGLADSLLKDPGSLTYSVAGIYAVILTCTDSVSVADTTPALVTITVSAPPAIVEPSPTVEPPPAGDDCGAAGNDLLCGDVDRPTFDTTGFTPIATCGTYSGNVVLTQDINNGGAFPCITFSGGILDLGGYTVTDGVRRIGSLPAGIRNGAITGNFTGSSDVPLRLTSSGGGCRTSPMELQYLTVTNTSTSGGRTLRIEQTPLSVCLTQQVYMHHVTLNSASGPASSDVRILDLIGNANQNGSGEGFRLERIRVNCGSTYSNCRGDIFRVPGIVITRSLFDLSEYAGTDPFIANGRAINVDGGTDDAAVSYNRFYLKNQRGVRIRESKRARVSNNEVMDCYTAGGYTCWFLHVGDHDTGHGDLDLSGLMIVDNVATLGSGGVFGHSRGTYITDAQPEISGNQTLCSNGCTGARFWDNDGPLSGTQSLMWLKHNPETVDLPTQIYTHTGATSYFCESGLASGSGVNLELSPCS
jgi:PKD repeat protein